MKKLDVNDPNVFNKWRALYWKLTNEELAEFADDCEAAFPSQQHHNLNHYHHLFKCIRGAEVLELGGWKGELACHCLLSYDITRWVNVEFCQAAAKKTVFEDGRYEVVVPNKFDWFSEKRTRNYDVFVSSHAIEHLNDNHFRQLVKYISGIPMVMLEAPLKEDGQSWDNDWSTHILTLGWSHIRIMMLNEGYAAEQISDTCYMFVRER